MLLHTYALIIHWCVFLLCADPVGGGGTLSPAAGPYGAVDSVVALCNQRAAIPEPLNQPQAPTHT